MKVIAAAFNIALLLLTLYLVVDEANYGFDFITWVIVLIFFGTPLLNLYVLYGKDDDLGKIVKERKMLEEKKKIEELSK